MSAHTMAELVQEYLAHRRRLGFALEVDGRQLASFARFADESGHTGPLTVDLAVRWATQPTVHPRRFTARRLDILRPFARYRAAFDPQTEVPPGGLLGPSRRRPVHHIYTADEITALVTAAARMPPASGIRAATHSTLLGLLAACGLRVSEALHLASADADLEAGVLTIRATKFRKTRMVPMHSTTIRALRAYADQRDRALPRRKATTFFVSPKGTKLPYSTVRTAFRRLLVGLGWDGLVPRPRIHDLRHAFACRRLEQWCAAGVELGPRIAALATYLGHAKVSDTYWYLTSTPELLALAAKRFEAYGGCSGGAP
jgi:integrase